jgi:C1A family cysteine protease
MFFSFTGFSSAVNGNSTGTNITQTSSHSKIVNVTKHKYGPDDGDFANPTDFLYMKNISIFPEKLLKNLPHYYDLRKLGRVTQVKDQGQLGTCWIFSTVGSLESSMLPGKYYNLSENNIKNILSYNYPQGFDRGYGGGGDWLAVLAYFARYSGPVLSKSDPYNIKSGISPSGLNAILHVQNSIFIPPRNSSLNNNQIKFAVKNYGAVVTAITMADKCYDNKTHSYYYNGTEGVNHDICIVGWDDNYSKYNFLNKPPGNGAFIVRNSWNSSWGDGGYFYMSYYDTKIANYGSMAFYGTQSTDNYNQIYQYDPYGFVNMIGYKSNTAWAANRFTSRSNSPLAATSFYALTANTSYKLYLYLNNTSPNPTNGKLALVQSGVITTPGYKTINLNHLISLYKGEHFSVVIRLTTPGLDTPISYQYPKLNYSSKAVSHPGESFISSNGINWKDITSSISNANVCLKAFTVNSADLLIKQTLSKTSINPGNKFQIIIKVLNMGQISATGVVLTEKLAPGLKLLSFNTNYGNYNPVNGIWIVGNLTKNSQIYLILNSVVLSAGKFTNTVTVMSSNINMNPKNSTINIDVKDVKNVTRNVSYNNLNGPIPLKNTGIPLAPLSLAVMIIIGGLAASIKRR